MMLPTHVLAGLALAVPVAHVAPEFAPAALAGAVVGSVLPDLDMYRGHRRTLHYPVYYPVAAAVAALVAVALPTPAAVGLALVLAAAALHCRMDEFGGSLELRPWERDSDRAVYDHHDGSWREARRWVRYDGSPRDFLLSTVLAVTLLVVLDGSLWPFRGLVLALLGVASVYTLLRRRFADLAEWLAGRLPALLLAHVPDRYRQS